MRAAGRAKPSIAFMSEGLAVAMNKGIVSHEVVQQLKQQQRAESCCISTQEVQNSYAGARSSTDQNIRLRMQSNRSDEFGIVQTSQLFR
jgi:hypothetical protein